MPWSCLFSIGPVVIANGSSARGILVMAFVIRASVAEPGHQRSRVDAAAKMAYIRSNGRPPRSDRGGSAGGVQQAGTAPTRHRAAGDAEQPGADPRRGHRDAERLRAVVAPVASLDAGPSGLGPESKADVAIHFSKRRWRPVVDSPRPVRVGTTVGRIANRRNNATISMQLPEWSEAQSGNLRLQRLRPRISLRSIRAT